MPRIFSSPSALVGALNGGRAGGRGGARGDVVRVVRDVPAGGGVVELHGEGHRAGGDLVALDEFELVGDRAVGVRGRRRRELADGARVPQSGGREPGALRDLHRHVQRGERVLDVDRQIQLRPIAVAAVASVPTSSIPQKRALEDDHLPTVSSPLNPDFKASKDDNPLARERTSRAKKESLKKRESKGGGLHAPDTSNRTTPDPKASTPKHKKSGNVLTPIRYKLPPPKITDFEAPRGPVFIPSHTKTAEGSEIHFNETTDQ